jgi:hypothetical protein
MRTSASAADRTRRAPRALRVLDALGQVVGRAMDSHVEMVAMTFAPGPRLGERGDACERLGGHDPSAPGLESPLTQICGEQDHLHARASAVDQSDHQMQCS